MIWLAVIGLLLVLLSYILFAPFFLEVDSERGLLQVRFHRLGEARMRVLNDSLIIDLRIAKWTRRIDLLAPTPGTRKTPAVKKKKRMNGISFARIKAIIKSFKVNRFNLNLAFDDVELNGLLFPLFFWLSRITGTQLRIDFLGVTSIDFQIENNAARIIRAFIFK